MSIEVYIWKGELPDYTLLNGVFRGNVGHASMMVIDETDPGNTIYISHRPHIPHPSLQDKKDNSKRYVLRGFCKKAEPITLEEECRVRGRKYDERIELFGLDEKAVRKKYEQYLKGKLPRNKNKYHVLKNNCCSMISFFLREGLSCPISACNKCRPAENIPDRKELKPRERKRVTISVYSVIFLYIPILALSQFKLIQLPENIGIVELMMLIVVTEVILVRAKSWLNLEGHVADSSDNFWSPVSLEYFAKKLSKSNVSKCFESNAIE